MNKKIIAVILLCASCLTGCSSKNESMYVIDKKPEVVEQKPQRGYGNVEAQVASDADTDKELGTKHVVIVNGIPFAELDGSEHPGENDKINVQHDGNSDIDNIRNAADSLKSDDTQEENTEIDIDTAETEVTEETTESDYSNVINKFLETAKVNELETDCSNRDDLDKLAKKYGIYFDPKDKCRELAVAVDTENLEVFAIGTYKDEKDLIVGLTSNKRTLNMINNIEVLESNNSRYYASVSNDGKSAFIDLVAINYNGEHYILEVFYLSDDDIAPKLFANMQSDLEAE